MPKSLKKNADCLRKERFSQEELNMLAETLQEHAEVVFSTNMSRPALLRKKAIWAEVAQKVSAVGTAPRTPKDVRKRWDDLRLLVHNILAVNRKQGMATGGGTQSDTDEQDTMEDAATPHKKARGMEGPNCPSTSRGRGQVAVLHKGKTTPVPPPPISITANTTAPTPATNTQEPVAEGTVSGASSIVRETAATAAVSDDEAESLTQGTTAATGPLLSPQLSPTSSDNINRQELSPGESWAASFSPPQSLPEEPTMAVAHHRSTSVPISQEGMRAIQQRQEELAGLLTQHITECGHARDEMRECASSIRSAVETSSKEMCSELATMRQVLSQMVAALQAMAPAQVAEQPATSSNASSTRSSPLCRSGRNLRRCTMEFLGVLQLIQEAMSQMQVSTFLNPER
ncbi:nuclear apoptosis-inducing factor 1-like [Ambystoma mexicanum]|uniref:nuclear apoptosis-inducing factor 1-like n=1 Tax=Ambystoma mexicanum TaxID=8296 RepID=UPI0037E90B84